MMNFSHIFQFRESIILSVLIHLSLLSAVPLHAQPTFVQGENYAKSFEFSKIAQNAPTISGILESSNQAEQLEQIENLDDDLNIENINISDDLDDDEEDFEEEPDSQEELKSPKSIQHDSSDVTTPAQENDEGKPKIDRSLENNQETVNEKLLNLEKEAKEAFSQKPYKFMSLLLSPGSEKLTGNGGSSKYDGKSQFLGLGINLAFTPSTWNGLTLHLTSHFHEFTTKNFVRVRSDSNASSSSSLKIQRFNLGVHLRKHVWEIEKIHHFNLLVGILGSQTPILETVSYTTGATQLGSLYYTGLLSGVDYQFIWSDRGQINFGLVFLLRAFNSNKRLQRSLLQLALKYHLASRFFLVSSFQWIKEKVNYDLHCPGDQQVSCSSSGRLESQLAFCQLGVGLDF